MFQNIRISISHVSKHSRREKYDRNKSQPVTKMNCCVRWPIKKLEWHAIDDVDFDNESDIPEVVPKKWNPRP